MAFRVKLYFLVRLLLNYFVFLAIYLSDKKQSGTRSCNFYFNPVLLISGINKFRMSTTPCFASGNYEHKFIVDGHWISDPTNSHLSSDAE